MQYLLDWAPFDCTDESGNVKQRSEFNVKQGAKEFKYYVRKTENLLKANLVNVFTSSEFYITFRHVRDLFCYWAGGAPPCINELNFCIHTM
jgi:hypothetical protein